jgi:hypothetical protein
VINVQDSWFVGLQTDPFQRRLWLLFGFTLLSGLALFALGVWNSMRHRLLTRATPDLLYNVACEQARQNQLDVAMHVLKLAFSYGFADRRHAAADPDLAPLREREGYAQLMAEPS